MSYKGKVTFQFHDKLYNVLKAISYNNKIMLLGDFNAKVYSDHNILKLLLGLHEVSELLLCLCILFGIANKYKIALMHPHSQHWYVYYVIRRRTDLTVIKVNLYKRKG